MASGCGFRSFTLGKHSDFFDSDSYVFVSYQIEWEGMIIKDELLWERKNRSIHSMKMYALSVLTETLGPEMKEYECHQIESMSHIFNT